MRDSSIFYRSFYEAIDELPDHNQLEVYKAIFEYTFNFKELELNGLSKTIFKLIKPQLDANNKKFENGKRGGRKPKENQNETKTDTKDNQDISKVEANVNANVNVNENENVINNNIEREVCESFVDDDKSSQPHSQKKSLQDKIADRIKRQEEFYTQVAEFKDEFPKELLRSFYDYWIEPNKSGTKMKYELEKTWDLPRRLARWQNHERSFKKTITNEPTQPTIDPRIAAKL